MKFRFGRRALAAGVAGGAGLAALEAVSLAGAFDHRRSAAPSEPILLERVLGSVASDGVVHVGHSTHLLCVGGRRLLTDPWFSDPAFGALAHARPPAWDLDGLGSLDAILVSHEHPDHADLGALDRYAEKSRVSVLVPNETLRAALRVRGFGNVHVLAAWEGLALAGVRVAAVPALHDVPEIGFVVEAGETRLYFAGDTAALEPAFAEIAERFRPTLALLPIDGTRLRGSALGSMGPRDAARAARTLGARVVVASHAEAVFTDPLAAHVLTSSVVGAAELFTRLMAAELPDTRCVVPSPGQWVAA